MARIILVCLLIFPFLGMASQGGGRNARLNILNLIPRQKHRLCGFHHLNKKEMDNLSQETSELIYQAYQKGLQLGMEIKSDGVTIIAPSISTSIKAREIMTKMHWIETMPRTSNKILVVVRSTLSDPLKLKYESYAELKKDAEFQLNITGSTYWAYVFEVKDDLVIQQESVRSFPVNRDD